MNHQAGVFSLKKVSPSNVVLYKIVNVKYLVERGYVVDIIYNRASGQTHIDFVPLDDSRETIEMTFNDPENLAGDNENSYEGQYVADWTFEQMMEYLNGG